MAKCDQVGGGGSARLADLGYQPKDRQTDSPGIELVCGPKTISDKPTEAASSNDTISGFGCKSKLKLKTGVVRDIVRDLNTNISNEIIREKIDFEKSNNEIISDVQCPLSSDILNSKPVPVKDRRSELKYDDCLIQPKREIFRQLDLKDEPDSKRTYCHTRLQRNIENSLKNDIDCQTQPKPDDKNMLLKQVMINNINNKISPKNKKLKTPVKTKLTSASINKILKPSPKAKSIKKPSKSKVRDIIRDFEGKIVPTNSSLSPLRKERKSRVGRKGNLSKFEVPSNQPDIRIFMKGSNNRDKSPNEDRENDI